MNLIGVCISAVVVWVALSPPGQAADVLTYHNNKARTGLNAAETTLTPQNVHSNAFGLLRNLAVDGQVYAQPLYASNVPVISGGHAEGLRNLLIVATEHDSVYGFDADSGALYWRASMLGNGEVPSDDLSCTDLTPEIGITGTPVIDRAAGANGLIYVLAMSEAADGSAYHYRLHALDLATGRDFMNPVTIHASVPGAGPDNDGNGNVIFVPRHERNRAGLVLSNGILYAAFGSFCDIAPYAGWVIAYNASTFAQTAAFSSDPNGLPISSDLPDGSGSGIWQCGAAPAVDAAGNLYLATANGPFDTNLDRSGLPTNRDYGDSFLKLSPGLQVMDYFSPSNEMYLASNDIDLASGGSIVLDLPDSGNQTHQLALTAGKIGTLYLFDRDNLGKFDPTRDNTLQEIPSDHGSFSSPAYFNGSLYFSIHTHPLQQLQFTASASGVALNPVPVSVTPEMFGYPGTTPSISSSGSAQGIVWAIERSTGTNQAILHAYDATNLAAELYTSAGVKFGAAVKFVPPTICNGKVFVATANSVAVFGLAHPVNQVDLNGDERSDIVFLNPGRNTVGVWLMNGSTVLATAPVGAIPPNSQLAALSDLANLGRAQLIWANGSTSFLAWATTFSSGGTPTTTATPFSLPANYPVLVGVDLDGDGLVDVVQFNPASGALLTAKNQGGLSFTTQWSTTVAAGWTLLGAADLNGNGSHQLLWRHTATGAVGAWVMAGFALNRPVAYGTVPLSWAVHGVGKVDATAAEGLIWQNTTTGHVAVWRLDTAGQVRATDLGVVNAGWQIRANASQDGPAGPAEILWANPANGSVGLWRVDGATVSSVVLGNPGTAWTVQPAPQLH